MHHSHGVLSHTTGAPHCAHVPRRLAYVSPPILSTQILQDLELRVGAKDLEAAANGVVPPAPVVAMDRLGNAEIAEVAEVAEIAEASVRDARRVSRSKTMARGAFELAPCSQGAMGARANWGKLAKRFTPGALQGSVQCTL